MDNELWIAISIIAMSFVAGLTSYSLTKSFNILLAVFVVVLAMLAIFVYLVLEADTDRQEGGKNEQTKHI